MKLKKGFALGPTHGTAIAHRDMTNLRSLHANTFLDLGRSCKRRGLFLSSNFGHKKSDPMGRFL
jgi:hypothetical protein